MGNAELAPPVGEQVEPSDAQRRHEIFTHPDRLRLEALLKHGKSPEWIALWLEDEYPLEDDEGKPHPEKRTHERLHRDPEKIEDYRSKYLSEYAPGFDVLSPELEDAIGRRFPAPKTPNFEIEVVEAGVRTAELNLARGLEADEELEMLQPTTLQAQGQLIDAAQASADLKASLGVPGYEPPPERVEIDQTNHSMSVELRGTVDGQGRLVPTEPKKVEMLRALMEMAPEKAAAMMAAAGVEEDAEPVIPEALSVPDETVDSTATEIPQDEELDDDGGAQGETAGPDAGGAGGASGEAGGSPGGDPA